MKKRKLLNNRELFTFSDQMGMIIEAGISPMEGIGSMLEDTDNKEGKEILEGMYEACRDGKSFYTAAEETGVFPDYALNMIKIGEKSGNLEEVMKSLAFYYNREENIAAGIKNAVTYPLLIAAMMLVVIVILIVKVLPVFDSVFTRLGSGLSGLSKSLMDFGMFLGRYSIVFTIIAVILVLAIVFLAVTAPGKKVRNSVFEHFFGTRKLYETISAGRFASGMALTMSAGLDMDESLEEIEKLIESKRVKDKVQICKKSLSEGKNISTALSQSGIFPGIYSGMLNVGYKTGNMENTLRKISEEYEKETDAKISNLISVLEPSLVIVLSLLVCVILLSVMLPLLGIMNGMIM